MKTALLLLLLSLLWSLVEVHSQTPAVPYVSFMGENLPNHAYVDLTLVGEDDVDGTHNTVRCNTDLVTCCRVAQGNHRGYWYYPGGGEILLGGSDIYRSRGAQRVILNRRNDPMGPSGIYRCEVPTVAVHDDTDITVGETVYVGLYLPSGGNITISDGVTLTVDSDLNGASPQFTLTCISTGGPATTVTWTRDSVNVTEGTETVLDDPVTAQYSHTLTVTGLVAGLYTCTVENNKPSNDSANITVQVTSPPSGVTAVQTGSTSITVSWSPSSDATGYRIDYDSSGGDSGSVTVSGGSTVMETLTGLQNGDTYTISIVATSDTALPSESVPADMNVGLFPEPPVISVDSTTATSITLSGGVPSDSVADSYEVMWERDTSIGCSDEDEGSATSIGEITDLHEDSSYTITVTASNSAGSSAVSNTVTAMTLEAAPSAPPTSVSSATLNSTAITVQWGPVDCIHRNGDRTGYSVQYGEVGSGSTQTMPVSGGSATEATISGLMPSTTYSIQVAAVTSAGTGPYSDPVVHTIQLIASAPTNVMAVQDGPTSIRVTWTPPTPLGDTTGYRISYTGGSSGSVDISGGSTDEYTLTGLQSGTTYTISIVGTSQDQPSSAVVLELTLIPPPDQPAVGVVSISATSISLSWSVSSGSVVTSSEVVWKSSSVAERTSGNLTDTLMYTIEGLESTTIYTITVTVSNTAGSTDSQPIIVSTGSDSCLVDTNIDACDCSSETDKTPAIVGGVVAVILIFTLAATAVIIVMLFLRNRRAEYITTRKREAVDIPSSTNVAVELSTLPGEATYVDPDAFRTTSNEAYNVVKQTSKVTEAEYETPHTEPPSSSQPSQPSQTPAGDYEPV